METTAGATSATNSWVVSCGPTVSSMYRYPEAKLAELAPQPVTTRLILTSKRAPITMYVILFIFYTSDYESLMQVLVDHFL